jgi:quercetin dioxygenase-like cupin family protein
VKKASVWTIGTVAVLFAGIAYAKGKEAVLWPAADIKWEEMKMPPTAKMPEGAKPPTVAALWGDATKGAAGALVKFQGGEKHPLHMHSAEIKGIVLEGTWSIGAEGAEAKKMGPGSYFLVPANWKHTSGCEGPEACTVFQETSGKFDMKMVPEAKK